MHVTTKQWALSTVAERWKQAYFPDPRWSRLPGKSGGDPFLVIYDRLVALGPAPTETAVTQIIGNESWTRLQCAECKQSVQMLVTLEGYGGADLQQICPDCLRKALALCEEAPQRQRCMLSRRKRHDH